MARKHMQKSKRKLLERMVWEGDVWELQVWLLLLRTWKQERVVPLGLSEPKTLCWSADAGYAEQAG